MENFDIYKDIAGRTGGDIYIGVVGPVRSGKSTLIKRFMEQLILPEIKNGALRSRTVDELPQSAAGKTIMTTEPKFVPEQAITVDLENGAHFNARIIDCVGYIVDGAKGHIEDGSPRMVKSPWYDHEIPFNTAAEIGTKKVISDHSTIGLVVTTDGSISDIPRTSYQEAEERVISELTHLGKPFVVLLNCVDPTSERSVALAQGLAERYNVTVKPVNCLDLSENDFADILKSVLFEFPVKEIRVDMPRWINMLDKGHWLQKSIYDSMLDFACSVEHIKELSSISCVTECDNIDDCYIESVDLGTGVVEVGLTLGEDIFYRVLGEETGLDIVDEASLMPCIIQLAKDKREYEKIKNALNEVEATGYGIVMPTRDELVLDEPEIIKQSGRYGVKLKASAPSIHMMKAVINTEVSPIVGTEKQSEDLVAALLSDFEGCPERIWESNIFGKSLHELVNEGLQNKLLHMPPEARGRMQETLEQIINDGCTGLVCIIL